MFYAKNLCILEGEIRSYISVPPKNIYQMFKFSFFLLCFRIDGEVGLQFKLDRDLHG